nr:integrase, catalytic region, zinc finger, CCHC-type, peptidase aspartic, catalytic [Tanacetum cinerariifolium]
MSNTNINLQTQTSNALHNAIMEAGGKDCPPVLALGIDNDIYSTVDACLNACEIWKAIERFYKMTNELFKNQCDVTNHQMNVQFLHQLQPKWQRFVTLVKQSQELKTVSYHKLYDILKQHQNEVNEIRAKRLARTTNPLTLAAQQQPVCHPQNHPNQYTQNFSTRSQQATTRNRGKININSPLPTYDQEPEMVAEDDALSKEKEIDKLMALISLSFNKITNLPTTTSELHQTRVEQIRIILQRLTKALGMIIRELVDWRDDTDDEPGDQELEAHYMYMAQVQEVTLDAANNSGPIFDTEPLQKLVEIILFIVDSGRSKHMTGNLKLLRLNHNLFFVGQFCDADLEVAFRKSTCYIRDLKRNDLLTCSRRTYLYFTTLQYLSTLNPICLMAKATSSQAWL